MLWLALQAAVEAAVLWWWCVRKVVVEKFSVEFSCVLLSLKHGLVEGV